MALYHLQEGNLVGANKLLKQAVGCLGLFRPLHLALDVDRLLSRLSGCVRAAMRNCSSLRCDGGRGPQLPQIVLRQPDGA